MSDTSVFDPETFLNSTTEEAGSTHYPTISEDDYTAMVEKLDVRQIQRKDGSTAVVLDVTHKVLDESAKQELQRDDVFVRQSIFLDLLGNGAIDWSEGKNVKLGKLREACGQNEPGVPWSPRNLQGAGPIMIHVGVRADQDDPETKYNDVKRTAKAA